VLRAKAGAGTCAPHVDEGQQVFDPDVRSLPSPRRGLVQTVISPIRAAIAFLVLAAVTGVVFLTVFGSVKILMAGRECTDLTGGVEITQRPAGLLFSFENRAYGEKFVELNTAADAAPSAAPAVPPSTRPAPVTLRRPLA